MSLISQLSQSLSRLPGLGPKSAQRIVYYLLGQSPVTTQELAQLLDRLHRQTHSCSCCHAYFDANGSSLCTLCRDPQRDATFVCVVAEHHDIEPIEASAQYRGRYHVLGGLLNPLEGITGAQLTVEHLLERLATTPIKEVVLAFDATMEGETTLLYLKKLLAPVIARGVKVTRLARGLPTNASLHYADQLTIGDAFKGRQQL